MLRGAKDRHIRCGERWNRRPNAREYKTQTKHERKNVYHRVIGFMARIFVDRSVHRSHRNLARPRLCVHARIVNGELVQEDVRGGPREAFDHTHLLIRALSSAALSHRSAKPAPFPVKVDRFDDKGIPFPMATRVAHPLTYVPMGPPI